MQMQIELVCDSGIRRRNDTHSKMSEFCDKYIIFT